MKTALYAKHCALGAKIVSFAGWEMPLQYEGIIQEHLAVRQRVGIFDVSHMGRIIIRGKDAEAFLDYVSTNAIKGKTAGTAIYTVLCQPDGGCVDDVIVYKENPEQFFVIANASNRQKDLEHLLQHAAAYQVEIEERFQKDGILAVQGPQAEPLVAQLFPEAKLLKPMRLVQTAYQKFPVVLSRTGYTGSGGFEIFAAQEAIVALWDQLLTLGKPFGIQPVGLGARDTLRLEMGYALYGHEIHEKIAPTESVSRWTVKWNKGDFVGKEALQRLESSGKRRSEYGVILLNKGVAREGYEVYREGRLIGKVTSGTFAPSLNQAIAIVLVQDQLETGDLVEIQIRQNRVKARVESLPFYKQ